MTAADHASDEQRPRPVLDAARSGSWYTVAGAVVTAVVAVGWITATQADALGVWIAVLLPLITAATGAAHAAHVVRVAEPLVTPVADPRAVDGRPLVVAGPGTAPGTGRGST